MDSKSCLFFAYVTPKSGVLGTQAGQIKGYGDTASPIRGGYSYREEIDPKNVSSRIDKKSASSTRPPSWGDHSGDAKHPRMGLTPIGGTTLSINFKAPTAARANNQAGWADGIKKAYKSTPPHEYRHAYQSLFVVPQRLKKTFTSREEVEEAAEEIRDIERQDRVNLAKGMALKKGWKNILKRIFKTDVISGKFTGGSKRKPVEYDPGRGFAIALPNSHKLMTPRDRENREKRVLKYIATQLAILTFMKGDTEAARIWNSVRSRRITGGHRDVPPTASNYHFRSLPAIAGKKHIGKFPGTRTTVDPDATTDDLYLEALSDFLNVWDSMVNLPLAVVEDQSDLAKKALYRKKSKLIYIIPAPEKKVEIETDDGQEIISWMKTRAGRLSRLPNFEQLRGYGAAEVRRNLKGPDANTGEKWSSQPSEWDAEFIGTLNKELMDEVKQLKSTGPSNALTVLMGAVFRGDQKLTMFELQKRFIDVKRFTQWRGARPDVQKKYKEWMPKRTRQIADQLIEWSQDNWPEDELSMAAAQKIAQGRWGIGNWHRTNEGRKILAAAQKALTMMMSDIFGMEA